MYSGFIILFLLLGLVPGLLIIGLIAWGIMTVISHKKEGTEEKEIPAKGVDGLLYVGQFIAVATTISSLITIIFVAIDHRFKDVLKSISSSYSYSDTYNELAAGQDVRLAVSAIVVAFPLFVLFSYFTTKRIVAIPERKNLIIRNIYLYGLILLSTVTMASSLVAIVYQLLSGELFVRFGPKALSLLVLSAFVFGYYFYSLKRDYSQQTKIPLVSLVASVVLIVSVIVFGVAETGSPRKIRAMRFDEERLVRLSNLQQQVVNSWQKEGVLPNSLSEMKNDLNYANFFTDPETGKDFEYKVLKQSKVVEEPNCGGVPYPYNTYVSTTTGSVNCPVHKVAKTDAQFEICATFGAELTSSSINNNIGVVSTPAMGGYYGDEYSSKESISYYYTGSQITPAWEHKEGRHCFIRTIKASQYSVYGK